MLGACEGCKSSHKNEKGTCAQLRGRLAHFAKVECPVGGTGGLRMLRVRFLSTGRESERHLVCSSFRLEILNI
jgi:hypothetical protein